MVRIMESSEKYKNVTVSLSSPTDEGHTDRSILCFVSFREKRTTVHERMDKPIMLRDILFSLPQWCCIYFFVGLLNQNTQDH